MKPHHLRFAGIGAYPGLVEIDFDDLGELGLYLVVGPTGSGKTTIFDAITFALYGKLAGQRSHTTLVSDHSHRVSPYVEIDFSHRGTHYRLHRVPPVNGKSAKTNDVWMAEYADERFAEPAVSRVTGATNVTDRVASIIGLDADQFMRVMLLPQNEFQQFLLATSTKKEELLRALFGTTLYERIAGELFESAKRLRADADRAATEIESIQASIRSQVDTVLGEGLGDSLPDPAVDLQGVIAELQALHAAATDAAAAATARHTAATAARATAVGEAKRFDAGRDLAELEALERAEAAAVGDATARLDADQRAQRVMPAVTARDAAHRAFHEATQRVADNRDELLAALAAVPTQVPVLDGLRAVAATGDVSTLAAELATARANLAQARDAYRAAALDTAAATASDAEAVTAEATVERSTRQISERTAAIATYTEQREAARALADSYPALDRDVAALDDLLRRADVTAATEALLTAQAALDAAQAAFASASDDLAAARRARTQQLAGELAQQLEAGDPCPVCGSTEHPAKAVPADGADVDALEDARDAAMAASTVAEAAYNAAHAHMLDVDALAATLPTPDQQRDLRERHAAAAAAGASCAQLDADIDTARTELTGLTAEHTAAEAAVRQHVADAARLRAAAATQLAAAAAVIDEAIVDLVATALGEAGHFIDGLGSAIGDLDAATGRRATTDQQLAEVLVAERFGDEAGAAAAALADDQRDALATLVRVAAERATRIIECRAVVGDMPLPHQRPDVDGLEAAERIAVEASAKATSDVTTLANAAASIEQSATTLHTLAPDVERQRVRAARAKHLADVLKYGGKDTLGIERWVQRTVFEEVCEVASVQLLTLSAGRYVLTLESSGSTSRKASAGLDLFVTDSHTGATRSVGTLSGGEQFLTSLALALALAEVVQRRSGGIELSTLFIDEGFGSLDGQTLDTAVEVLRSLQDTGRTVGVISHVDAMQQELRIGIRVTPGPTGSTVAVHPDIN